MSDERQAFEQLHAIPSGVEWCEKRHIYIHKKYSGLVLHPINESWKAFCEGALWQASREGVGGDSESIIGFHNALQRVKKIFSEYRQDWPKWGKRLDGTPALNDLPVRIAAAFSELYTHPVSADVPEKWRTVMKELADDLESEIEARRSGDLDRRIERDLIVVKEARVLLNEQEQGL